MVDGMATAITSLTTAVTSVVGIATTGEMAIFFYSGLVGIAINIVRKLKR